ncbi:MAG: DUF4266 domain-containing protein [Burkholderiaceae bacterium]|nr:DUF4266 domain-containing protein [Burkholderiaceae bacterium]
MDRSVALCFKLAAALALSVGLIGCGTVQPWQKGNLAKEDMAFDPDPLQTRFAEHTYHSKEGATGGLSVGGGGCGCN